MATSSEAAELTSHQVASQCADVAEVDSPGHYVVVVNAKVSSAPCLKSEKIACVPKGTGVQVLEIVELQEERRIRAHIRQPAGWISLLDTECGHRWATKTDAAIESIDSASYQVALQGGSDAKKEFVMLFLELVASGKVPEHDRSYILKMVEAMPDNYQDFLRQRITIDNIRKCSRKYTGIGKVANSKAGKATLVAGGAASGAGVGFLVAGPLGAIAGTVGGMALGGFNAKKKKSVAEYVLEKKLKEFERMSKEEQDDALLQFEKQILDISARKIHAMFVPGYVELGRGAVEKAMG